MKAFKLPTAATHIWFTCLCILTILQSYQVKAFYTMQETCAYLEEGYIADPSNCKSWGYCSGGILLITGSCAGDQLYYAEKGVCASPQIAVCHSSTKNLCKHFYGTGFLAHPHDCSSYCYCDTGYTVQCSYCPGTQVFQPERTECVWPEEYACTEPSICQLVQNNQLVGDPDNCGNYIRCYGGTGQSQSCWNGQYFNPRTGICQVESICESNTITLPPDASKCANVNVTGDEVRYVSDVTTCAGYYACSSSGSSGQWRKCPFGSHFNPELEMCVSPYTYACPYDRCDNLDLEMVTSVDDPAAPGCTGYLQCKNGASVGLTTLLCRDIRPEYPYFDEVLQACITTVPNFAICTIMD